MKIQIAINFNAVIVKYGTRIILYSNLTSINEFFTMEKGISRRHYASLKPDLINAIVCTQSWVPTELKSMAESSRGFGEMLEDIKLVDELI